MSIEDVQDLIEKYFPPSTHPYRVLEENIDALVKRSSTVLEIGCGRDAPALVRLRGKAARLIGIDVVPFTTSHSDFELFQASAEAIPIPEANSVDVAFSRSVMEHLEHPGLVMKEIARVLRPGATYIALTPSFWDYGSLVAYLVPNRFHARIVRTVEGRPECDTFPTHYRANTRSTVTKLAKEAGLELASFAYLGQYPNYAIFNRFLFLLGCHYERFLMRRPLLHPLLGWILYKLQKPF